MRGGNAAAFVSSDYQPSLSSRIRLSDDIRILRTGRQGWKRGKYGSRSKVAVSNGQLVNQCPRLCQLPVEILDRIRAFLCSHSDYVLDPDLLHVWAKAASLTCKAIRQWLLPLVWIRLTLPLQFLSGLDGRKQKAERKNGEHLPMFAQDSFRPQLAVLYTLVIDANWRFPQTYAYALKILSRCTGLRRLALGDQQMSEAYSSRKWGRYALKAHAQSLPWQFDPQSSTLNSAHGEIPHDPLTFPHLQSLLLMDSNDHITYDDYANMLQNSSTGITACPDLRTLYLVVWNDGAVSLTEQFIDAMITFCKNHPKLREVHFEFRIDRHIEEGEHRVSNAFYHWAQGCMDLLQQLASSTDLNKIIFHYVHQYETRDGFTERNNGRTFFTNCGVEMIPDGSSYTEDVWTAARKSFLEITLPSHQRKQDFVEVAGISYKKPRR